MCTTLTLQLHKALRRAVGLLREPPGLEAGGSDLRSKENPKGEAPQEEGGGEGPREAHPSPGVPTTDGTILRRGLVPGHVL